jgi:hypothetical protein
MLFNTVENFTCRKCLSNLDVLIKLFLGSKEDECR